MLLELIPDLIVGRIKDHLAKHRVFAYLFYGVDAALWFLVFALEVYRLTDAPDTRSLFEVLLIYGPATFFLGSALYSSYQLARNERGRARALVSADPDYVLCPSCYFEQWKGYTSCQKCGGPIAQERGYL